MARFIGDGDETRIGLNGESLAGDPELTSMQQNVVDANTNAIRGAIDEYMRRNRGIC